MLYASKRYSELIKEISLLKQKNRELEQSEEARKQAEDALKESEERYRIAIEGSIDGVVIVQKDLHVYVNQAYLNIFGYGSPDEIVGKPRYYTIHPDDHERTAAYSSARQNGEYAPARYELKGIKKDGTLIDIEISANIISYKGEKAILAYLRDITERKRAEEELGIIRNRLSRAEIISRSGNWEFDLESKRVFGSDGAREIYGLLNKEWTIPEVQGIPLPEYRGMLDMALRDLIKEDRPYDAEFKIRRPDTGETIDIHSVAEYDRRRNVAFGIIQDITERKHAEEALRESEQRLQALLDASPVAISWANAEGNVLYCNRKFSELFGYTVQDIPTVAEWRRRAFPDPAYLETIPSYIAAYNEGKEYPPYEATVTCKDGSQRHVIGSAASVSNMILLMLNDITERKHLESELQQAQKMEAIGHLAGGVAHDFNNILTAIIGFGTLMEMDLDRDSSHRAHIGEILRAAGRAAHLTQSLLAFSRKQIIQPVLLNLNESIDKQKMLLGRLIGEDIQLIMELSGESLIVKADPGQMDQVVMNVVTNARDAMPQGGIITIGTKLIEMDDTFIAIHGYGTPGTYTLLSISDTGCGMDERILQKVFDPFFTTKEVGKGTGLGLSVVYGIVKQHNGYIDVKSQSGVGTTFFIYLPIIHEKTGTGRRDTPQFTGGHETILVAEDEKSVRSLMRAVLEKVGYTVIEARDGNDALRIFGENLHNIDLAILDVVMPGMNGKEVYKAVKRIKPEQKILFSSGYTDDIIATKGVLEDGPTFISKPIKPVDFLKKIREILDS